MSEIAGLAVLAMYAVAFGIVPVAFIALVWLHLRESRRHPERLDTYGWVLVLGPPALIVAGAFARATFGYLAVDETGSIRSISWFVGLVEFLWIIVWKWQLAVGWVIGLAAVIPARRAHARLTAQRSGATPVAGQYAVAGPASGSVATERTGSSEHLPASGADAVGAKRGRAPGPPAVFFIGVASRSWACCPSLPGLISPELRTRQRRARCCFCRLLTNWGARCSSPMGSS